MGFERAIQSLGNIEEKLRKAFGLAGPIGAKLDPVLQPVVIVHDFRDPGFSSTSGRGWAWINDQGGTPAGVTVLSVQFAVDVFIEALYVSGTVAAATPIHAYFTRPLELIPIAVTGQRGAWRDAPFLMTGADSPPIQATANWGALTGSAMVTANTLAVWGAGTGKFIQPMGVQIPAGGTLTWRSSGTNTELRVGMWGRVWP